MSTRTSTDQEDRLTSCASKLLGALRETFGDDVVESKFGADTTTFFDALPGLMGTSAIPLQKAFGLMHLATQLHNVKRAANRGIAIPRTRAALTTLCADAASGVKQTNGESIRPNVDGALDSAESTLTAMKRMARCEDEEPTPRRSLSDFEDVEDEEPWSIPSIGKRAIAGSLLVLAGTVAWWLLSREAEYDEYEPYGYDYEDGEWSE